MTKKFLFIAMIIIPFLFTSCDKDEPEIPPEEELITTLTYSLTSDDGSMVILSFIDLDGDGLGAPTIIGGTLDANTSYSGTIQLLNELETPTEDVTEEIEEEDDEHQFFFESSVSGLMIAYDDQDDNGNPVGLSNTLTTGEAATGSITITLRHEPNKSASGVSDGNIANAGGETDIEVTFPITVE